MTATHDSCFEGLVRAQLAAANAGDCVLWFKGSWRELEIAMQKSVRVVLVEETIK